MLIAALSSLILIPVAAQASDQEPTTYIIKKGDTLWGLSEQFLKDPAYWPDMWSKNPIVTNPHLVYPGQKVRIFPDRIEVLPEGKAAVADKAAPAVTTVEQPESVAEEKTFIIRGTESFLLLEDLKPYGSIIGIHDDRIIAGEDDIVFTDIGTASYAKGGEKFSIFRSEGTVSHPVTNEIMGKKIIPLGMLQLTNVEKKSSRAIIIRNYKEISAGSFLLPYREDRKREISLKMPHHDLKGYVLDSYSGANTIAAGDIVHLDIGEEQGGEPGNMLYIVRDVTIDQRYSEGRIDRLPQELLGALVILETNRKTSMALVVKSIDAIYKGDKIVARLK